MSSARARKSLDPILLQRVLDEIPIEYRERFAALTQASPPEASALLAELPVYLEMVRKVSAWVTALDPEAASRICATCAALLQRFAASPSELVVRATVQYFIEEDEDDEVTGVLGFDDDIQVINAVCRVLNAEDLVLPLIR